MGYMKLLYYACLLLLGTACLTACGNGAEQKPPQTDMPLVYYNDYLGLSISVPTGWQVNMLSENLSEHQGETAAPRRLDYGNGSSRMELIDMQSSPSSSDASHSRFCAYAELFSEPVAADQYVELLISLLEADSGGYTYTLQKQEQLNLSLRTAERVCLQVSGSNAEQEYMEEYYIVSLEQGFLVFYINYWPQNEASRTAAFAVLGSITL